MHITILAGIISRYSRTILTVLFFSSAVFALTGCGHEHVWKEATCTEPRTCTECGETEGEPLGHKWAEATCTEPRTCSVCGKTEGKASGHVVEEWEVTLEPTCTEAGTREGTCKTCGQTVKEEVKATGHTPAEDWEIVEEATSTSAGTRAIFCVDCGEQIETESYELSEEEKEEAFKDECETFSYEEIARDPDDYIGKKARFTGEVIQVMQQGNSYTLRVDITKTRWGYDDTILVSYSAKDGDSRILEDDIVTMYGLLGGTYTYETVMGNSLTVPLLYAEYISIE